MLSALVDRPELNKKDLCKNSMSTTTQMKCAGTQTIDCSADEMADPIQPKPCSSAPFYHQLNSYRLESKIKFDEFKKPPPVINHLALKLRLIMQMRMTKLEALNKT